MPILLSTPSTMYMFSFQTMQNLSEETTSCSFIMKRCMCPNKVQTRRKLTKDEKTTSAALQYPAFAWNETTCKDHHKQKTDGWLLTSANKGWWASSWTTELDWSTLSRWGLKSQSLRLYTRASCCPLSLRIWALAKRTEKHSCHVQHWPSPPHRCLHHVGLCRYQINFQIHQALVTAPLQSYFSMQHNSIQMQRSCKYTHIPETTNLQCAVVSHHILHIGNIKSICKAMHFMCTDWVHNWREGMQLQPLCSSGTLIQGNAREGFRISEALNTLKTCP